MPRTPVRVLIADDHEMVREGLRALLSDAPDDIEVIGQACDGAEAVRLAQQMRPDVVLMDLSMPRLDGIEATRVLRESGCPSRVILLTGSSACERVREAIQAGAIGYLFKEVLRPELLTAIAAARDGKPTLHPMVQAYLMQQVSRPATPSPFDALTPRERDVLRLIAAGNSNKEIGRQLGLSVGTVKGYVSTILAKLDSEDRTQAALLAVKHGLDRETA